MTGNARARAPVSVSLARPEDIDTLSGWLCEREIYEDAFMLANLDKFRITGETPNEREAQSWDIAVGIDKADFAMKYAILDTDWTTPLYIEEGLQWLATPASSTTSSGEAAEENADD